MIGNIRVGGEGGMIAVDRWVSQLIRIMPSLVCEDNHNHLWAFMIIIIILIIILREAMTVIICSLGGVGIQWNSQQMAWAYAKY